MTNKNRFQILIEFFMLTIGSIIAAFAIEEFLVPNTILDGGVIGIGIMINNLTKLPLSMLTIILNIPFLLFGLHKLGKIFIIKAAYCMIIFSLFVSLFAPWTNGSHNEWADAAVEYQKEHYPNMTLLEDNPRVESDDNGDTAYNVAKELIKTYPDLKGIMGTSSFDAPGVARAIQELGLVDKFFTSGTGMPADNAELLKSGVIKSLTLWDPAKSGEAMVDLACKVLAGEEIGAPVNLNVDGYTEMNFREGSETVLEGQGWITIDADNVDDFGF